MLDLQEAGVISTSLEAILYGFSIFMFTLTMWIMLRSRRRRQYNSGMILAACSLFVLSTAEMAVNISRVYQGFITVGPRMHGGPAQYFDNVSELTFVVKSCLYNAQTLILDGAVIYRTYVVWQSWLIVIFPMLGWCGLLGTSLLDSDAWDTHAGNIFAAQTGRWITSLYALTLTTNLSSTLRHGGRLMSVLRVVIESGAIYSVTITAALATFVSQSNSVYIILDMISPIITIVFNMIIVRIGIA
ncbi:hypothetical protein BD413DRAFT_442771, partial [Trametes elegans]